MSWLLFIDESGHDHRSCPFEVRGGIAIHTSRLEAILSETRKTFREFHGDDDAINSEMKGSGLLKASNFKNAKNLHPDYKPADIRKMIAEFRAGEHSRNHFAAYGHSSIQIAKKSLQILNRYDAKLFASIVPRHSPAVVKDQKLRRDFILLLSQFSNFLKAKNEHGLLVMDQVEQSHDRRVILSIRKTSDEEPHLFSPRVLSTPLFVSSDLSHGIQLADLCLYAVNWGAHRPTEIPYESKPSVSTSRPEIEALRGLIDPLIWHSDRKKSAFYYADF